MRALWVLGGLALAGLFLGLGGLDWVDDREARDAAVAREMVEWREILTPVLGGMPQLAKPVLAYLPEAAAAAITPRSPVAARAYKAALAVALVLLIGALGRRWLGARAGWLAAAVLATSLALPVAVRTDGTQLLATLLGWLGWAGLTDAMLGDRAPRRLTASYMALAAALVIAGPLPALWPLAAVALHRGLFGATGGRVRALAGVLLMLGVALPWYGAMFERLGPSFALALPAFPYAGGPASPWYLAPARVLGFLVVGFFPWSTLLPAAVLYRWTAPGAGETGAAIPTRWLVATLLAALVPQALASAAPLPAVLPALPAAALLVGALLDRAFAGVPVAGRAVWQASWLVGGAGTVAAVMMMLVSRRLAEGASELRLLAAFQLLAAWAPALAAFIGRTRAVPALLAMTVAIGAPLVAVRTLPALQGYLTSGPVATAMNEVSPKDAPLLVLEAPPPSVRLRLERRVVVSPDLARALRELGGSDGWAYVAFAPRRQSEVARAAAPAPVEILMRTPAWVLGRVRGR